MHCVVGTDVEIVIDNSFNRGYMAPCSIHRAPPTLTMRGTVILIPKWMEQHCDVAIKNVDTGADNFIPKHRIISIGGMKIEHAPVAKDVIFTVKSSKSGTYTVRQDGRTKRWSCTCTGFQFHKKCRHTTQAQEAA